MCPLSAGGARAPSRLGAAGNFTLRRETDEIWERVRHAVLSLCLLHLAVLRYFGVLGQRFRPAAETLKIHTAEMQGAGPVAWLNQTPLAPSNEFICGV